MQVLLSACGTAKLADVGLSRMQTRTVMSDISLVGTFAWWAGRLLRGVQGGPLRFLFNIACSVTQTREGGLADPSPLVCVAPALQGGPGDPAGRAQLHQVCRHLQVRPPAEGMQHCKGQSAARRLGVLLMQRQENISAAPAGPPAV